MTVDYAKTLTAAERVITTSDGTKDKTTPPFHTDDLHAGIKNSKLVRIAGKGHMLNWEAPVALVDEIIALAS